jgi:hypothetical protein
MWDKSPAPHSSGSHPEFLAHPPLVGSMDRHACSWRENSPAPRLHTPLPADPILEGSQRVGLAPRAQARSQGMRFSEHLDGDGVTIFEHMCKLGEADMSTVPEQQRSGESP